MGHCWNVIQVFLESDTWTNQCMPHFTRDGREQELKKQMTWNQFSISYITKLIFPSLKIKLYFDCREPWKVTNLCFIPPVSHIINWRGREDMKSNWQTMIFFIFFISSLGVCSSRNGARPACEILIEPLWAVLLLTDVIIIMCIYKA